MTCCSPSSQRRRIMSMKPQNHEYRSIAKAILSYVVPCTELDIQVKFNKISHRSRLEESSRTKLRN